MSEEEIKYKCRCGRILEIDDMDVLGFVVCGCPDCGTEYTEMETLESEVKNE